MVQKVPIEEWKDTNFALLHLGMKGRTLDNSIYTC